MIIYVWFKLTLNYVKYNLQLESTIKSKEEELLCAK